MPVNDTLPEGDDETIEPEAVDLPDRTASVSTDGSGVVCRIRQIFRIPANTFGVWKVFSSFPRFRLPRTAAPIESMVVRTNPYWPYPNISAFLFGGWFWGHKNESRIDRDHLIKDVLFHRSFRLEELRGVNFKAIDAKMAAPSGGSAPEDSHEWTRVNVDIRVPLKGLPPEPFSVASLFYRRLTSVIRDVFTNDTAASKFCYQPYAEYWNSPWTNATERLHGELYTSDAFIQEHERILKAPATDTLPRAVAALMLWSDSTHLTSFGQASMWPIYLFFGNQSKYERCQPSSRAAQHVAYLPSVSGCMCCWHLANNIYIH